MKNFAAPNFMASIHSLTIMRPDAAQRLKFEISTAFRDTAVIFKRNFILKSFQIYWEAARLTQNVPSWFILLHSKANTTLKSNYAAAAAGSHIGRVRLCATPWTAIRQ